MNPTIRLLLLLALLVALAELAAGALLSRRARDLAVQRTRTHARLAARPTAAASPVASADASPPASSPAPAPTPTANPAGSTRQAATQRALLAMRTQPDYAPFRLRTLRRQTMRQFGDLLATLNLPADRCETLKALLDERQSRSLEAHRAAEAQGFRQGTPGYTALTAPVRADSDAKLREFLGEAGYQHFVDQQQLASWRMTGGSEIGEYFADQGVPVPTPAQLAALFAAYRSSRDAAGDSVPAGDRSRIRNRAFAALAAPHLDPAQRDAFGRYLEFNTARNLLIGRLLYPGTNGEVARTIWRD